MKKQTPMRLVLVACTLASLLPGVGAAQPAQSGWTIQVTDSAGKALQSATGTDSAILEYNAAYKPGDVLKFTAPAKVSYLHIQVDELVPESLVYCPNGALVYPIPFEPSAGSKSCDPKAFVGEKHKIKARLVSASEIGAYRNVALNPADKRGTSEYFPHATANSVTRNESCFAEKNAIDGSVKSKGHGKWPLQSWGPEKRDDLEFKLDFGRPVEVDKLRLMLRADFPHDAYWSSLTVEFSDGSTLPVEVSKPAEPVECTFAAQQITWLKLTHLKQATRPLGWAALTEIEAYGKDAAGKNLPHNP